MVGSVVTIELNNNAISAGFVCVMKNTNVLEIITISHLDPDGFWQVISEKCSGKLPIEAQLCKLAITDIKGDIHPLKFNQWSAAIKNQEVNSSKVVSFELIAQKFKGGAYIKNCTTCYSQFYAASKQVTCHTCCEKNVTAKIIINKEPSKKKRPRLLTREVVIKLLTKAYQMGKENFTNEAFKEWLEKQF